MIFIIGTGNRWALVPPIYLYRETFFSLAAALATAIDTPKIALAPNLPLFSVPSNAMTILSMALKSASLPLMALAILVLTLLTAFKTPLPPNRLLSPSRNSIASNSPVEAPEGTAARPKAPEVKRTSTSTVGLPRESIISRPLTDLILDIAPLENLNIFYLVA